MATATGTAVINFGALPGTSEAQVTVTGQTTISATSKVECFVMGDDSTSDHNASDHRWLPQFASFVCGTPVAGSGFTIYARAKESLTGQFALRWVWAD